MDRAGDGDGIPGLANGTSHQPVAMAEDENRASHSSSTVRENVLLEARAQPLSSLPRTASQRMIFTDNSMLKEQRGQGTPDTITEHAPGGSEDHTRTVPCLEEIEMTGTRNVHESKNDRAERSTPKKIASGEKGKIFAGDVVGTSSKEDPLHQAGFQTVTVSLDHPLVKLQRWVVAGLVHWEFDGVKQISNALMYFITASEIQLLTVDGPVPSPPKQKAPFSIMLEPLKRIRYITDNRRDVKISQLKVRVLEDIVEAKANTQRMPPCLTWPFAMAWWNKCAKKRKLDDDGTSSDSKEASVDFTKCYGCGTKIKKEVFMFLDHSFCSEKCRARQMRRPYRTYTARPWMS